MRVVVFTDSLMLRDLSARPYALRDQFVHFISPLGDLVESLSIVARCKDGVPATEGAQFLECGSKLSFVGLPFYKNTEDFYRRSPFIYAKAAPIVWRAVRDSDVVILRVHHCLAGFISVVARIQRRPLAIWWAGAVTDTAKSNYPGRSLRHLLARQVARWRSKSQEKVTKRADLAFLLGEGDVEFIQPRGLCIRTVPNLVPSQSFADEPRPRGLGPLKVTFAGSMLRHKGIFDLLDAVADLKGEGVPVSVRVAGQGPQEDAFRRAISRRGLAGSVEMLGWLRHDQLRRLLMESEVFVLPSHAEGLPKVLWEAWAAGLAVIASNVGSVAEFLKHRENGLLIEPGDSRGLAAALELLAKDEPLRLGLGEEGIATARKHTWEAEIERIRGALESIHLARARGAAVF